VEVLLLATARVLAARGWAGTTTNHIAARAGVSIGSLYEYFPSKEALAAALALRHVEAAETRLAALATSLMDCELTLELLVKAMVSAMIELHAENPRLHRVLFEEVPLGLAIRRRVRAMEDHHARALAAVLPRLTQLAEPELRARVTVELLETLTHRWVVTAKAEPLPRETMQAELERLVLAYLRAPVSAPA
jgi:AcrR family transcriptional regulator